jgi:hypothetical protein
MILGLSPLSIGSNPVSNGEQSAGEISNNNREHEKENYNRRRFQSSYPQDRPQSCARRLAVSVVLSLKCEWSFESERSAPYSLR